MPNWLATTGTLVDPARRGKPKDKPRVARRMLYVRDLLRRGREWTSLAHIQEDAVSWCREVAGRRSRPLLQGASPLSVFEAVERYALIPLPDRAVCTRRVGKGIVGPDIDVKAGRKLYSVPWRHIGRQVDVRSTRTLIEV